MNPYRYLHAWAVCLLCAAGLSVCGHPLALIAQKTPVSFPHNSPNGIMCLSSLPDPAAPEQLLDLLAAGANRDAWAAAAPAPAREAAPNWPAVASMIAAGTELLALILFNVLAATAAGSVILVAVVALGMAVGCFSLIQGIIRLRRMKKSGSSGPEARKRARNAIIWGAIANFPLLLLLIAAFTFEI